MYHYGCFHVVIAVLSSLDRESMAHKTKDNYSLSFAEKRICLILYYVRLIFREGNAGSETNHDAVAVGETRVAKGLNWLYLPQNRPRT